MAKRTAAIVLAGGKGTRMGSDTPKQFLEVEGHPLIYYSLKAFENSFVDEIVLVCSKEDVERCTTEIVEKYEFSKVKGVVAGGTERYHSVYNGMKALRCIYEGDNRNPADIVMIHDGARPLVSQDIINRVYEAAELYHAAVAAVPAKDTVKMADTEGFATETLRRDLVWLMQTPQAFDFYEIYEAYSRLIDSEADLAEKGIKVTDDAMVLELFSERRVKFVEGDQSNIKVTTPDDLHLLRYYMSKKGV